MCDQGTVLIRSWGVGHERPVSSRSKRPPAAPEDAVNAEGLSGALETPGPVRLRPGALSLHVINNVSHVRCTSPSRGLGREAAECFNVVSDWISIEKRGANGHP
ncbi:hypothetical protein AAFF_G00267730 [Aldrovandia affinis]|uniref:Uncharacterized protein n=1 Tax=Aldrovandia affinis TaxID=143900 RepID=A0AAD7WTI1_9TELE|nr:hypothetical protein AAFF_G00267730 [Aldrovandia affinis]